MDFIQAFTIEKEAGSQVKITGEIPYEHLAKGREAAIKTLGKNVEVDGFRKGHVPEHILVERIGEMAILGEMAERAIARLYPHILTEHNLDALGFPQIQITKIAPENPLGFTITVAVAPEITLPNYKQIAVEHNKNKESHEVTDEELDIEIKNIQRQKIAYERLQQKAAAKAEAEKNKQDIGDVTELPTPESVSQSGGLTQEVASPEGDNLNSSGTEAAKAHEHHGETHVHADGTVHEGPAHPEPEAVADADIPELTDEYVKTLGQPGQFATVEDFKTKLREHLQIEKERELTAKHRADVTDAIMAVTEVEVPKVLVDSELQQIAGQMEEDIKRAGLKVDDYLAHIKKTKEDLLAEWKPAAEKRAKLQLVLDQIAKTETITPDENEVKTQVDQILSRYKDADEHRVRAYVTTMLRNEAVMKSLEAQK